MTKLRLRTDVKPFDDLSTNRVRRFRLVDLSRESLPRYKNGNQVIRRWLVCTIDAWILIMT